MKLNVYEEAGCDAVELNFSCPQMKHKGMGSDAWVVDVVSCRCSDGHSGERHHVDRLVRHAARVGDGERVT